MASTAAGGGAAAGVEAVGMGNAVTVKTDRVKSLAEQLSPTSTYDGLIQYLTVEYVDSEQIENFANSLSKELNSHYQRWARTPEFTLDRLISLASDEEWVLVFPRISLNTKITISTERRFTSYGEEPLSRTIIITYHEKEAYLKFPAISYEEQIEIINKAINVAADKAGVGISQYSGVDDESIVVYLQANNMLQRGGARRSRRYKRRSTRRHRHRRSTRRHRNRRSTRRHH